jgi:hypothetical protein
MRPALPDNGGKVALFRLGPSHVIGRGVERVANRVDGLWRWMGCRRRMARELRRAILRPRFSCRTGRGGGDGTPGVDVSIGSWRLLERLIKKVGRGSGARVIGVRVTAQFCARVPLAERAEEAATGRRA